MSEDVIIECLVPVSESWAVGYESQQGFVNHTLLKVLDGDMLFPVGAEYDVMFGRGKLLT